MISSRTAYKIVEGKELTDEEVKEVEEHAEENFDREEARERARKPLKIIIVGLVTFILAAILGAFIRYEDSITKEVFEEALTVPIGAVLFSFLVILGYADDKTY